MSAHRGGGRRRGVLGLVLAGCLCLGATAQAQNAAPVISGTPATFAVPGQTYLYQPVASDPNGDRIAFGASGLPSWAKLDKRTGRLYGRPKKSHLGKSYTVRIAVSDGRLSSVASPFTLSIVQALPPTNRPPTVGGTPPESINVGQAYSFVPSASDAEGQPLTFSIAGKPAWASFDPATGRLSGTPSATNVGTAAGIVISVSDGQATSALAAFSVTVLAVTPGSATVSWSPPTAFVDGTPIENLAGFRVVYGTSASALSNTLAIPSATITSATVEGLAPGTWYFAVKAYTTAGIESDPSVVASKTIR